MHLLTKANESNIDAILNPHQVNNVEDKLKPTLTKEWLEEICFLKF